jgi:hypothetical protein
MRRFVLRLLGGARQLTKGRSLSRPAPRFRPGVEGMEDRVLPSAAHLLHHAHHGKHHNHHPKIKNHQQPQSNLGGTSPVDIIHLPPIFFGVPK